VSSAGDPTNDREPSGGSRSDGADPVGTGEPAGPTSGRDGPSPEQLAGAVRARRRSAPRYRVFIGIGVLVGVFAAFLVTTTAEGGEFEAGSVLGYTALLLALVGGLLGGGVAVLLDRR